MQHCHATGPVLARIAADRLLGKSLPQITDELNHDMHLSPARGGRWSVSTVRNYQIEAARRLRVSMNLTQRRAH